MKLTDQQLDQKALKIAEKLKRYSLDLIETLIEINKRKSFADHGYHNLFTYIVEYLGFSRSQAALYNNVIRSKVIEDKKIKSMVEKGEITLSLLDMIGQHVRKNKNANPVKLVTKLKDKSRDDAREVLKSPSAGVSSNGVKSKTNAKKYSSMRISSKNRSKLEKLKKKLGGASDDEVLSFLLGEVTEEKPIKENKSITPKTKVQLLKRAKHRCEYIAPGGKRCKARSFLEIEHIKPRAKGGGNHPGNLKVLCSCHNKRAGVKEFGVQKMNSYHKVAS